MTQRTTNERAATQAAEPASLKRRIGAIFYDWIIVVSLLFIVAIAWTGAGVNHSHPGYRASVYLVAFLYFAVSWMRGGQTVGMKVWKIKLISSSARRFGWLAAMTRCAAAALSFVAFGAGFWWTLLDRKRLAWHDRLSESRLIRVSSSIGTRRDDTRRR